jgi:brefeldin A-inhibited guanine nucleotide-exchange protein
MLQTDLHNPQVKKHMTMEEFVRNNRGIDNGKDLPRDLLEEVYCNIRDKKVGEVLLPVVAPFRSAKPLM